MPALMMAHDADPKDEILAKVGSLDDLEVFHNQVIVALYVRPQKTKGGILLTDGTRGEDKYQGKVGLVLKIGPQAFVSDEKTDFHGQKIEVGDWVFFKASDGWPLSINAVDCRIIDNEFLVRGRIASPDVIY